MNKDTSDNFIQLLEKLRSDFTNENLHNVVIDYCIENEEEVQLIEFYKANMGQYPQICQKMLERLSDLSVQRLYNNKIKKKTDEEGKKTAIKLIVILIATIIAMFFIWKGLLSSFRGQFLQ
ncbi:MAG: hypothetical protein N3B13_11075 [Deltaproteobacteria bacterium]|nr:hypothetical protein [Deltaproteobacteria bacterium]